MMIIDPYRFVSSGGGVGAHNYWRVLITANDGSTSFCGMTELELRGSVGGPDLTNATDAFTRGTGSSQINADNPPGAVFNDNFATGWLSATSATSWVKWDFVAGAGDPQEVVEIAITGSWNAPDASPKDFELQWSDNDLDWTTVGSWEGETGWTGADDTRVFAI